MTILDALKAEVQYPLSDNAFLLALTKRGLTSTDTFTASSSSFDLATADCLLMILRSPNISEGGYSVSQSEKKELVKQVNALYARHGHGSPFSPKARFVQRS